MKILIVDDNATNRKLVRVIFEKKGYGSISEAADGMEGIEVARALRPDLIISDALMPRMDGFQFLWAVKMDEQLRDTPFVFHSSVYTGLEDEELALRLGAEGFLPRPMKPDDFWSKISAIMERIAAGNKSLPRQQLDEEREYLRRYSAMVAGKLEEKVRELEDTLARRARAEEELIKLSLAVEQSPVSILITDLNGRIEFVNPKFCQITGYSAQEVIGRNPRFLKSGETPPEEYRRLWGTISSGGVWRGELHNKRKNGELYWESAIIAPVKNRAGAISHYLAIKEDISAKKELEAQLLHAQKMEAVGTLAGGVAHDFNNILTAIIGYGAILKMKMPPTDPLLTNVIHIQEAAERAAGLTRSLLACSRKQSSDTQVYDLVEVVSGMEPMLRRLIREDIELRITVPERAVPVLADRGQLEQVLLNLATNASDAMEKGGTITITTVVVNPFEEGGGTLSSCWPGRHALLTFTDTGTGMDDSVRQRIFEPFFTTKGVGKGTGLGLAICYGIIKQHDGHIECRSEPGKGTTFRIHLPVVDVREERKGATDAHPLVGGHETIMLAEDDPTTMTVATHILKEYGYTVIPAADGAQAVAVYRDRWRDIDLCLLDVVMPKLRGCETAADIRRINPRARIILMSGYSAEIIDVGRFVQEGAGFISKPLRVPDLVRKIRESLDR